MNGAPSAPPAGVSCLHPITAALTKVRSQHQVHY
jgi:hypothetical protein